MVALSPMLAVRTAVDLQQPFQRLYVHHAYCDDDTFTTIFAWAQEAVRAGADSNVIQDLADTLLRRELAKEPWLHLETMLGKNIIAQGWFSGRFNVPASPSGHALKLAIDVANSRDLGLVERETLAISLFGNWITSVEAGEELPICDRETDQRYQLDYRIRRLKTFS